MIRQKNCRMKALLTWKPGLSILAWIVAAGLISQARPPVSTTEGNIAKLAARILEQSQYTHHSLDDEIAAKFLERYLEELDGQHLNFLQSDLDEFAAYRTTLDELVKAGNTAPAHVIYDRFLHRLEERVRFATEALQKDSFEFNGNDRYAVERRDLPAPQDLNEAVDLWRQRLRYEYLQEKLNKRKPEEIVATLSKRYSGLLRTAREADSEEILELYLTALANAYDPHSDYLGRAEYESL